MIQIVLDEALRARLHGLREPVELCEPDGEIAGRFIPAVKSAELQPWEPPLDLPELMRRANSTEPRSTAAEFLARLKNVGCSRSNGTREYSTT